MLFIPMKQQRFDPTSPLRVRAEAVGEEPFPWAWAIYRGAIPFLIVRSRPEYRKRTDALEAGSKAATDVGRRLRAGIIEEETI